jgi:two-component system, sensor histidine kinase PdtaS
MKPGQIACLCWGCRSRVSVLGIYARFDKNCDTVRSGASMASSFHANTAIRATGIALLSMLALMAVILIAETYASERTKAQIAAHRAAHVVATQFTWVLEASDHALQRIEAVVRSAPAGQAGILNLTEAARDLPSGLQYTLHDANGTLTHSSLADPINGSIANRADFISLRDGAEVAIEPMINDAETDAGVFVLSRRLDQGNRFRGVASVSIPLTMLEDLTESLDLPGASVTALVRTDGMLIARTPSVAPANLSQTPLFDQLRSSPEGYFETAATPDGVKRIIGYWRLADWPVVATAGLDSHAAMAGFWRTVGTAAILALPILLGVAWLIHDLSRLMRQDERRQRDLTRANERSSYLLREIHHRVKNNLQTVGSLIRLERLSPETKANLMGRINAMVEVHEAMYRADQFEEICVSPYLDRLVENVARGYGYSVEITMEIAELRLPGERAMQLGLLVNELVANAFKHAFAPRRSGKLEVRLEQPSTGTVRLVVEDDGPGYETAVKSPQMGSRLINAFASQLGGTCTVDSDDRTAVTVEFPLHYATEPEPAAQPLPIQDRLRAGASSMNPIRTSSPARSSKRT